MQAPEQDYDDDDDDDDDSDSDDGGDSDFDPAEEGSRARQGPRRPTRKRGRLKGSPGQEPSKHRDDGAPKSCSRALPGDSCAVAGAPDEEVEVVGCRAAVERGGGSVKAEAGGEAKRAPGAVSGGTLVVCPLSMIGQWRGELESKTRRGALAVCFHYGAGRNRCPPLVFS